ncbi:toll/interleukin-1 receptor domain-containing protein [Paramagnetospirillum marisnigri]|uniref:toll/interleukin-1 receptor domain-containing protein n=1 Tax=Paramagnetospirillum marisnigri TaxID=1285242 RepID=UPI0009ED96B5|nr:toll/interleukin-1 receptor domain-containing protein [Paramagnetospirillum marisnigri]
MTAIFISHSSKDNILTEALVDWLVCEGFTDVFVDNSEIRTGDRWADILRSAKASCRIVICLVTPDWLNSDECFGEFLSGWYAGKRIVPLFSTAGHELDERQQRRMSRIMAEDQGFDLTQVGAPGELNFDSHPAMVLPLVSGLRAGGALARIGLDPLAFAVNTELRPDPFPGLESFGDDDADAALFFGRSPEIAACIEELREMRASGDRRAYTFLGASGSGKSSLMKAGVLPRLRRERGWLVVRSFRPGADPLYAFADALSRTAIDHGITWAPGHVHDELITAWRRRPTENTIEQNSYLVSALEKRLSTIRERSGRILTTILYPVDQAEELVHNDEESAIALADYLSASMETPPAEGAPTPYIVTLTVRDDCFPELRSSEKFRRILTRTADIRPLPSFRFSAAIEQPAERYNVVIEPSLAHALIEDAPESDALPLLAFALRRLWTRFCAEKLICISDYEALGKLHGLIDDAAERALRGMDPRDDRPLAAFRIHPDHEKQTMRAFIPALAQLNDRGQPIRCIAPIELFSPQQKEILEAFVRWRLLIIRGKNIEVAHEAMFREWPRFAEWLKPERENLEALRSIENSGDIWDFHDRNPEYLSHRGRRLWAIRVLFASDDYKNQIKAMPHVADYIHACTKAERRRILVIGLAVFAFLLAGSIAVTANKSIISGAIATFTNISAASAGASVLSPEIRGEYEKRRMFLRATLQRYMQYALTGTVPSQPMPETPDSAAIELLKSRASNETFDAWSIGQVASSLDKNTLDSSHLNKFYDLKFINSCSCWAPIDGSMHMAASDWIIISHALQGVYVKTSVLSGILQRQSKEGGWPLFFDAIEEDESNSTYSTSLTLLSLHHLAQTSLFDPHLKDTLLKAITRARAWLHSHVPSYDIYWSDYPDAVSRKTRTRGNTAFVIFTLLLTGGTADDIALFQRWFASLEQPTPLDDVDASDRFVKLKSNGVRLDSTRHLILPWELAAIHQGARHLAPLDKIRARRYFIDSLSIWPTRQTGGFDYVAAETLYTLNTLLDGNY